MERTGAVVFALAVLWLVATMPSSSQVKAQSMGDIAGDYWRHGFILRISPDGSAEATWRVYLWCGAPGVTGACDAQRDNQIINGGHAEILFTSMATPAVARDWSPRAFAALNRQPVFRDVQMPIAEGVVVTSTHEERIRVGPIRLVLLPYNTAAVVQEGDGFLICGFPAPDDPAARGYRLCGA